MDFIFFITDHMGSFFFAVVVSIFEQRNSRGNERNTFCRFFDSTLMQIHAKHRSKNADVCV